jgi:hypothetical protein
VARYDGPQLLPLEKAAVVLDGVKLTTDIGPEVCLQLGKEEAEQFYTEPCNIINGVNRGGLGWSSQQFHAVAWTTIESALKSKPDMFQLWLLKQFIGICTTRRNMARIQDRLDNKCPNCNQPRETSNLLNQCPEAGRTLLFRDCVASLVSWMNDYNWADAELAYWIGKYLIFQGTQSFTSQVLTGGGGSPQILAVAASQDTIGWTAFLYRKVSKDIGHIQEVHCALSPCRITGEDWMKMLVTHLIQISHSQWILQNFTLHDKHRGYLRLKQQRDLLREVDSLLNTPLEEVPEGSKYLL